MQIRPAQVEVLGGVILVRFLEDASIAPRLAAVLRGLEASPDPESRQAAEQVRAALEQMRQAREERARHRAQLESPGSTSGTSEPAESPPGSESEVSPPWTHRVAEVAERLEVSESYVKRLCRSRALSATKAGRDWVIDGESVARYEAARRPIA